MPLRFWNERGCAIVVFEGTYDIAAALEAVDAALRLNPPSAGLLLDLTDSDSFRRRSSDDLRHTAAYLADRQQLFSSRLATVGGSDLPFGLLRMGTVFAAEHHIQNEAFRSRDKALDWLRAPAGERVATAEPAPRPDETAGR